MPNQNLPEPGRLSCPVAELPRLSVSQMHLAERRARALAPTIFCPSGQVDLCVRQAMQSRIGQ